MCLADHHSYIKKKKQLRCGCANKERKRKEKKGTGSTYTTHMVLVWKSLFHLFRAAFLFFFSALFISPTVSATFLINVSELPTQTHALLVATPYASGVHSSPNEHVQNNCPATHLFSFHFGKVYVHKCR